MPKPWTVKEQKECSLVYSTEGMKAAMAFNGRSRPAIKSMMRKIGTSCAHDNKAGLIPSRRSWYREDVIEVFEMAGSGLNYSVIAEFYNSTANAIALLTLKARRNGFDAYPLRGKQ
tara:strand:+ start:154 stop:501 length:348 start_codon:yes stop_codon:yes gene_type:complete